ncbi:type I DNA topoisomerase [Mycoplasmopsis synoviae]|uniref:type I DNA topoisomerase n=1 Tax=Mycoplasmopsis synoviae TaxID=2109 RepID=UPI0035658327
MNKLVIVESPNKVKTIQKYLGNDYNVISCVGHIYKMKTSGPFGLGIDFENWEPLYEFDSAKKKVGKELKDSLKKAKMVYIATDPDREGESIGENLVSYLKLNDNYKRVTYNEITKDAILKAFDNPHDLNWALINAQKSRRMLDRIIGFRLSKLLQSKLQNAPSNASAGRVQSIALKLVIDREREILAFVPTKYWKLNAFLLNENSLKAQYFNEENSSGQKEWIFESQIKEVKEFFEKLKDKKVKVTKINVTEKKNKALVPFKQAAIYKRSPYSAAMTQSTLQKLYEGYGDGGLISYPRTDSTRLSQTFVNQAKKFIESKYGSEFVSSEVKGFTGDQDAHEAIRPTDLNLLPENLEKHYPTISSNEVNLYKLIYEHTLKALIKPPVIKSKQYIYQVDKYLFKNSFATVTFKGYYCVSAPEEKQEKDPNFEINQEVTVNNFAFEDLETKPTPRYNDGSLIEALDDIKVGRPSTFASTVKIIKDRQYVEVLDSNAIKPTDFGMIVLDKLVNNFPEIINEKYTAEVEGQLDLISENKLEKNQVMHDFYTKFNELYDQVASTMEKTRLEDNFLDEDCPDCSGKLLIRLNRKKQKFIGCKSFPNCTYTRSYEDPNAKKRYYRNYKNTNKSN